MEVRILGRVLDQIGEQVRERPTKVTGGLLIGSVDGGTCVERALPCPNVGESGAFAIDPQVIMNVERSLSSGPTAILGTYRGARDAATDLLSAAGNGGASLPGPLRLEVVAEHDGNRWTLHQIEGETGAVELPVQVVRPAPRRLAACPE